MTARDEMAVLFERRIIGEDPDDRRYERALRQAASELDDLASLATNPETAPVVFRWLVEAGVLARGDEACDCTTTMPVWPSDPPWDKPWDGHYHVVVGER